MKVPIVFIIFKRLETTERVFNAIRQAKPKKLFVLADGPRGDMQGEVEMCQKTRDIVKNVDWDCEVITKYSDVNLGCRVGISSGLDWVFSQVEEAIILEDDCLPDQSFFLFCEELLEKYRHDKRVMSITGTNTFDAWQTEHQSYHFSYYASIWGWATWRRAWEQYDVTMNLWNNPQVKVRIRDLLCDSKQYKVRERRFNALIDGKVDAWGPQWTFCSLINSGLTVVPSYNLISNLGFGSDATHTNNTNAYHSNRPTYSMKFPLIEPVGFVADREYDRAFFKTNYASDLYILKRLFLKFKKVLNIK